MRVDVSEPEQCGCVTCVQHRTLCIFKTKETEPSNVIGSSFTSVPASSGPVQATGDSSALGSTSTSSPVQSSSSGTATPVTTSVDSEPAQPIDSTNVNWGVLNSKDALANASASSNSSPVQSSSPTILNFRSAVTPVSSEPAQALSPTTSGSLPVPVFGSTPFAAPGPSLFCLSQTPFTNISGSGTSAASRPSLFGPMQAPVQASAPNTCPPFSFLPQQDSGKTASANPSPFSYRGDFARPNDAISPAVSTPTPTRSSPFGPRQEFPKTGVVFPRINQENTLGCSLPGFGVNYLPRYPSNLFWQNHQTSTPVSGRGSFLPCVETEQGSRCPGYTPKLDGQDKYISISASSSHGHKSHEELRWEDYKNGDKGERPNAIFSSSTVSPSLFASPNRPDHLQRRTTRTTQENMTSFPPSVTSLTSGCTACGATSGSSSSSYLGFNVATNPPSAATSLPGFYYPLMFATPNLAALGTTTNPAVQLYPMILGTPYLAALGTTTNPAVQLYPMILGTPNLAAQGTTTAAVQPYPVMFGTPNLAVQGTSTPAVQPYPVMFGSPNLAVQGTTPAVQPYPMMFGSTNLAAQGTTQAVQAYLGGVLPFANMNLQ